MSFLRQNFFYFLGCLLFLIFGLWVNYSFGQKEILLAINRYHSNWLDFIMPYYTYAGDGIAFLIVAAVLMAIKQFRMGLTAVFAWALQGIAVQVLKQKVFPHSNRPWTELSQIPGVHLPPNFSPFLSNSFPSGHSATAFCMFTLLALFTPQKKWKPVFFFLACLVAFSRLYLLQHYFMDVYAGFLIGITGALIVYFFFYKGIKSTKA